MKTYLAPLSPIQLNSHAETSMKAVSEFVHSHLRSVTRSLFYPALGLVLAVTAACGGGSAESAGGRRRRPRRDAAVPVEMVTLEPKPVEQVGEFVGTVKSRRSTTIQPQAEGFLTRILVKSGDRVAPGTPLFEIDATSQQAAVGGARVDARRARGRRGVRPAAGRAREEAARRRRDEPAGVRPGDGAAADRRGAAQSGRRADPAAADRAGLLPRHRRRRPASSATFPSASATASRERRC